MANLGPIGSGQPPAIPLASWGPLAPPTNAHRVARTRQARPRTPPPPPPQAPWTRHKQPASMGSSAEAVPTPSAEVVSHFFCFGEKCEKLLEMRHPQNQLESERMTQNPVPGVNLEGLHQNQHCQRFARQTLQENDDLLHQKLLHSVLGKNLEDAFHHCEELECQRSAPQERKNQGESLEDLRKLHDHHAELECQRSANEGDETVGTSTSCSASCGSLQKRRDGMFSRMILGTSKTCSATTGRHEAKKR